MYNLLFIGDVTFDFLRIKSKVSAPLYIHEKLLKLCVCYKKIILKFALFFFVSTGTISVFYGATLGGMYSEFSQALSRYTHNLLARNTLSETLQNTLLHHLGVSPWSTENTSPASWPLQVYPRTLSVLAQVNNTLRKSTSKLFSILSKCI